MATWTVEKRGSVWSVPDRQALVRLARVGALSEDDLVRGPDDEALQPAGTHPGLSEAFDDDPWAAWDDLADQDPDALWAELATLAEEEEAEDPPTVDPAEPTDPQAELADPEEELAEEPVPEAAPDEEEEPPPMAPEAVEPEEPAPPRLQVSVLEPGERPRRARKARPPKSVVVAGGNARAAKTAEVIDFPGGRVQASLPGEVSATPLPLDHTGDTAADPLLDLPAERDDDGGGFRPLRVALLTAPFLAGLLFFSWWVPWTAQVGFGDKDRAPAVAPEPVEEEVEPRTPADVYDDLLAELHGRLFEGALDVEGDEGLETALLIELSRMGLDIQSVKAKVKTWAGPRANPIPEEVEIRVTLRTTGELERELASVGLVVGKYVLHYGLRATRFEVRLAEADGTTRVRALNANAAARLYGGRSDLVTFLLDRPE